MRVNVPTMYQGSGKIIKYNEIQALDRNELNRKFCMVINANPTGMW